MPSRAETLQVQTVFAIVFICIHNFAVNCHSQCHQSPDVRTGAWLMQDVPPVYDLYAVSNHFGGMGGGHYNAYCKMPDGNWWCFDDSHVHAVDKDKICSSSAYVLFYRRRHEAQQDTGLHCTTLPCTALHCPALPCTALHCPALHCPALQCPV